MSTVAFDLDGTLAVGPKGGFDRNKVGEPIPAMLKLLRKHLDEGDTVYIFTARADDPRNIPAVRSWLKKQGLPDLKITNRKTKEISKIYDDIAVGVVKDKGILRSKTAAATPKPAAPPPPPAPKPAAPAAAKPMAVPNAALAAPVPKPAPPPAGKTHQLSSGVTPGWGLNAGLAGRAAAPSGVLRRPGPGRPRPTGTLAGMSAPLPASMTGWVPPAGSINPEHARLWVSGAIRKPGAPRPPEVDSGALAGGILARRPLMTGSIAAVPEKVVGPDGAERDAIRPSAFQDPYLEHVGGRAFVGEQRRNFERITKEERDPEFGSDYYNAHTPAPDDPGGRRTPMIYRGFREGGYLPLKSFIDFDKRESPIPLTGRQDGGSFTQEGINGIVVGKDGKVSLRAPANKSEDHVSETGSPFNGIVGAASGSPEDASAPGGVLRHELTHAYTGGRGDSPMQRAGFFRDEVLDAYQRYQVGDSAEYLQGTTSGLNAMRYATGKKLNTPAEVHGLIDNIRRNPEVLNQFPVEDVRIFRSLLDVEKTNPEAAKQMIESMARDSQYLVQGGGNPNSLSGQVASARPQALSQRVMKTASDPIETLRAAKAESDRGNWSAKYALVRGLVQKDPGSFAIDSVEGGIAGITHIPSGFRIHVPVRTVSEALGTKVVPIGTTRPGKPAIG